MQNETSRSRIGHFFNRRRSSGVVMHRPFRVTAWNPRRTPAPQVANSQHERQQRLGEVSRGPVKSTNGTFEVRKTKYENE